MVLDLFGGCAPTARVLALTSLLFSATAAWAQTPAEPAPSVDPSTVIATVDGEKLTERDLQLALEDLNPGGGALDEQKREQVIGFLINVKLIAQAAEKAKLQDTPDFQARLAFAREKALMSGYLKTLGKDAVTEAEVRKVYDETVKEIKPEVEVRARHVLVESEDEAKKVAERLKKGEDFAAVAKEASKDPGSGAEGGDLGFFTKEQMVPEFSEAAFKMEPGQVSDPVKSQFGWHIIKVEEKREKPVPVFDEVRGQIEEYVQKRAQEDALKKLRDEAKIERVGGPPPAAPDAAAPSQP